MDTNEILTDVILYSSISSCKYFPTKSLLWLILVCHIRPGIIYSLLL